jgi:hypothetical protein
LPFSPFLSFSFLSFPWLCFIWGNLVPLRDEVFPQGRRPEQKVDGSSALFTGIAPSDFYLFGKVKNDFIGKFVHDEQELVHEVVEILSAIPTTELQDVFRN